MYSNQVYIMLQLLNYSKTIQKHIKYFKDKSFISKKYNCLFTQIHDTHYSGIQSILSAIYSQSLLYNHTFCL